MKLIDLGWYWLISSWPTRPYIASGLVNFTYSAAPIAYELSGPRAIIVNVSSCDSYFGLVCNSVGSDKERVLKCGLIVLEITHLF